MFSEVKWSPIYDSYSNNLSEDFYNPIFKSSRIVKRASGYFSSKALAKYSEGIKQFNENSGKYYLIISEEITVEDYRQIVEGYSMKDTVSNTLSIRLDENLSIEEYINLSNLAYFISIGVIEIKIALTKKGIFHDKFAIFTDSDNNKILMQGSNNETLAALESNYESFGLNCSWLSSDFDLKKIYIQEKTFDAMWNNQKDGMFVITLPSDVMDKLVSFSKGKVIFDKKALFDNSIVFELVDDTCVIKSYLSNIDLLLQNPHYKINVKYMIKEITENYLHLINGEAPYTINKCYKEFVKICDNLSLNLYMSDTLKQYLRNKELYLEKRYRLGASIKNRDSALVSDFNKFKSIITDEMARTLRERQLWDAFFMTTMKKSSNFSVPGSGKTSSVYAVFAYLQKINKINKIIMIGPKNSFISWKTEFESCFGNKKKLRLVSMDDKELYTIKKKSNKLQYHLGDANVVLINYEITPALEEVLSSVIDQKCLLVFDEVHKIKAVDGVQATSCVNIAKKSNYVITMTGTPIPNSYQDIYNNLNILFPHDYDHFFNFDLNQLKNPNEDYKSLINSKLFPFFCRTTKKQLLVPDANQDICNYVNSTKNELLLFNIIKNMYKKNKLALIIRLLQLESNPKSLLKKIDISEFKDILDFDAETDNLEYFDYTNDALNLIDSIKTTSKMKETRTLVKNLIDNDKTVIIWAIFIDSINELSDYFSSIGIANKKITGSTSSDEREKIIKDFQDGKIKLLLTNPHTLAESVSLHNVCHDAVYFEYSYNLVHLLQSKDRIHRLGLKDDSYTQYYFMGQYFNEFSLDKNIYERLKLKEENMLDAIDNNILENVYATEDDIEHILRDII